MEESWPRILQPNHSQPNQWTATSGFEGGGIGGDEIVGGI
jgi:hypothetical protein